jgi:hypothetical protein
MAKAVDRTLFRYSVTLFTRQREVLAALRGLSFAAQRTVSPYVTWNGTDERSWREHHYHARFYFTDPEYRSNFLDWAADLLKPGSWQQIGEPIDDDPMPEKE